jgi:hypothetical protein
VVITTKANSRLDPLQICEYINVEPDPGDQQIFTDSDRRKKSFMYLSVVSNNDLTRRIYLSRAAGKSTNKMSGAAWERVWCWQSKRRYVIKVFFKKYS